MKTLLSINAKTQDNLLSFGIYNRVKRIIGILNMDVNVVKRA